MASNRPTKKPATLLADLFEHAKALNDVRAGKKELTQEESSALALDLLEAIKAFRHDYQRLLQTKAKVEISLQDAEELRARAKLHLEKAREKLNAIAG